MITLEGSTQTIFLFAANQPKRQAQRTPCGRGEHVNRNLQTCRAPKQKKTAPSGDACGTSWVAAQNRATLFAPARPRPWVAPATGEALVAAARRADPGRGRSAVRAPISLQNPKIIIVWEKTYVEVQTLFLLFSIFFRISSQSSAVLPLFTYMVSPPKTR